MLNTQSPGVMPLPRIRVLIVDDSVVMRKILSDALRDDVEIEVVGTASNGIIALQRVTQLSPDVVTLDIEMPEMDGIATLREIKRQFPRTRVLMCSTLTERGAGITLEALSLGADDYLTKNASQSGGVESFHSQLGPKIKQFFRESRPVGPEKGASISSRMVQHPRLHERASDHRRSPTGQFRHRLSPASGSPESHRYWRFDWGAERAGGGHSGSSERLPPSGFYRSTHAPDVYAPPGRASAVP